MARKAHRRFCLCSLASRPPSLPSRFRLQIKDYAVVLTHAWYDVVADGPLRFARFSFCTFFSLPPIQPFYSIFPCSYLLGTAWFVEKERKRERKGGGREKTAIYRKSSYCLDVRLFYILLLCTCVRDSCPFCSSSVWDQPSHLFTLFALAGISLSLTLIRNAMRRETMWHARYFLLFLRP